MLWLRTWQLGIKSLLLHPLRSLLTILGMFVGVASVIWLLAIGEGISYEAQKQIEGLGADNIIARSVKPANDTSGGSMGPIAYGLLRSDYERLVTTIPTISSALPIREMRRQFAHNGREVDGRLVGCTPAYAEVTRLEVARGRFLTDSDLARRAVHCVLSAEMAERLYPLEDPLGKTIRLPEHNDYYTIVGILKPRNPTAAIGGSLDAQDFSNDVYVPITTVQWRIGDQIMIRRAGSREGEIVQLNQITLRVKDISHVAETAELVKHTLSNHKRQEDVAVVVPLELLEQARTMRLMFILFMGLIAAISLLVGGIGIMNIMLATVTERTREIGIRRALGAKRSHIITQFLVETIALSIAGGLTGVVAGMLCPSVVVAAREAFRIYSPETMANLPDVIRNVTPIIVWWSVPVAFSISVLVGIVFGVYPAIRAARMDPIEALRHE